MYTPIKKQKILTNIKFNPLEEFDGVFTDTLLFVCIIYSFSSDGMFVWCGEKKNPCSVLQNCRWGLSARGLVKATHTHTRLLQRFGGVSLVICARLLWKYPENKNLSLLLNDLMDYRQIVGFIPSGAAAAFVPSNVKWTFIILFLYYSYW